MTNISKDRLIAQLAQEARTSLSTFCSQTCKALCCKSGQLIVSETESILFPTTRTERPDGLYAIQIAPKCIHLNSNNQCSIYDSRPKPCRDFPVYVRGETIVIAGWCQGQQAGLLQEFVIQFEKLGCKVVIM